MDTTASDSEIAHSIINLSSSSALIGSSSSQISDQQALQDFSLFVQRTDQETASTLPINDHESPVEGEKPALRKGRPSRKKGRLYKQTENLEDFPEPMPIPTVGSSRRGKKVKSQSPSSPPSYQPVFSQAVVSPPPFLQPPSSSNPQSSQYPQPYSPYILSSPPSSSKKRSKSNASDDEYEEGRITFSHTLPPLTIPQVRVPPGTQPVYIVVPVPMYHPHPTNYSQQQQQQQQQQYQEQDNSSDSDYQASIIEDEIEERTPTKRNYEKKRKIDEEEKIEEMKRKRIEIDDNNDSLFDRLVPGEGILYRRRRKLNTKHKADEANGCSDRMYSLFPKISTCCGKTKSLAYNGSQAGKGYHYILKYKPTQVESDRLNQIIKDGADLSLFVESSDSTKSPFACYSTLGKRTDNSPPVIAFRGASQYLECCFRVEKEGEKRHGISDSSSYTLAIKSGDEKIVSSQPFKLISKEKPEEPCGKAPTCIRNRPKIEETKLKVEETKPKAADEQSALQPKPEEKQQ